MRILYRRGKKCKRDLIHKTGKINVARIKRMYNKCVVNHVNENLLYAGKIIKWKSKVFAALILFICIKAGMSQKI